MALTPRSVFRYHEVDGVPSSGEHKPKKAEIIQLLDQIQGSSSAPAIVRQTRTELNAVTPASETYGGLVLNDPNPANNGYYSRSGGSWVFGRGFPDTFARVALSGSGSALTGEVNPGVNPSSVEMFYGFVQTDNTGPLSLSIGGEPARAVVNLAGNPLSAGEWTKTVVFTINEDSQYQLIIDAGAAAAAAQSATDAHLDADRSEAAADQAEAWAALAYPAGVTPEKRFAGDGVEQTFTLDVEPISAAHVFVAIEGVLQSPDAYTISGADLIFVEAPPGDGVAENISARVVAIADGTEVPPDGSVTTAKLANGAATFAKIQDIATAMLIGRLAAGSGDPEEVPISALMEYGSNANGHWLRFPLMGVQIVWGNGPTAVISGTSGGIFQLDGPSFDWPQPFSVPPHGFANMGAGSRWADLQNVTALSASIRMMSAVSSATALTPKFFAIGLYTPGS